MASDKGYLDFILEQLSGVPGASYRAMMGEYILYVDGKVVGGIYDNRLLVKPTPSARALMPDAPRELPYPGAKELLLVEAVDNRAFLTELFAALAQDAPAPKRKKSEVLKT
ncbi:MAG: TfoX/Sxy family protein [Oscillospiraceae bacterium]|nr:TfoX/Sxy family protein [Oscillospiraceae bacterium]